MDVVVAAATGGLRLDGADDFTSFRVLVETGGDAELSELSRAGARVEGDHVWIPTRLLRQLAAGRVDAEWEAKLAAMTAYASSKGWYDAGTDSTRAHVEHA